MTDLPHSEERYPLLFLFLDDGQKSSRKGRGVFFERSRSHGIVSGASAVLTQWPGQLSSCGLAIIALVTTTVLLFLMLVATTIKPVEPTMRPRCIKRHYDSLKNTNLYLVHDEGDWQQNQLDALEDIATKYNQCNIELTVLWNQEDAVKIRNNVTQASNITDNHLVPPTRFEDLRRRIPYSSQALPRKKRQAKSRNRTLKEKSDEDIDLNINIGATKLLKAFLERRRHLNSRNGTSQVTTTTTTEAFIPTLDDLLARFPRISLKNVTKKAFFEESPLHDAWKKLNANALVFAARILKLWENGGISFELPETLHVKPSNIPEKYTYDTVKENVTESDQDKASDVEENSPKTKRIARTLSPVEENRIIKNLIDVGYNSFKALPEGLVTVDEEGVHMETKTTCHAFFGEALAQLQAAANETSVPEVIRNTLKTFCERGAVDSEYCSSIKT